MLHKKGWTKSRQETPTSESYPEEKETEQELDVEGESGSVSLIPL